MLLPGRACSEASSMDRLELLGGGLALGVSSRVAAVLAAAGNGAQLLLAVRAVASQLEYSVSSSDAPRLQDRLSDVHSCIVAVDDALDSQQHTTDHEETRQWLKQLQNYVLQLSKQAADAAAGDAQQQCEASSSSSSMDEGLDSSNCSMAGTAACDTAWRMLCQDASDVLGRLADQLSGGAASSDYDSPRTAGSAPGGSSRLVARQSRLSYAQYWSKKIAL
ncbi:hypothetical protein OEZ85_013032 [Tetradesmus obliquus]|uniref:Rx N-terminal domain-containing protein n=1 Tax=Tetradesmus obliquus TaxID=3088 RepID=A0ABY8U4F5_TETOB|nr:hypothetical protein OEZ85_013032 [Tetradesmus obliquus]